MDVAAQTIEPMLAMFVERLLAWEAIDAKTLERAERVARSEGQRLDRVLNSLGLLSDDDFARAWSSVTGWPIAHEIDYPSEPILKEVLPPAFLRSTELVPLSVDGDAVSVASLDPLDRFAPAAITAKAGLIVRGRIGRPKDVSRALAQVYPLNNDAPSVDFGAAAGEAHVQDIDRLRDLASDAPVIRIVQDLLSEAVGKRASDIHLTISRRGPRARLRVDGILQDVVAPPVEIYDAVISRIKIMSGLDIAERRLPQDGSARAVVGGREIDLRTATMPHLSGEGAVLRILDKSSLTRELSDLGVAQSFIDDLRTALSQPHGLILMTGPTGSGKTTTLYAALRSIARPDRNIVTIEDPVEYQLDGQITQIEVNARIGFDFPKALRAVLRQDPDVILVGEIRDTETASIAARAAMTGHLVLASVHTNTAAAALPRLIDMGIEPYILASTVRAVMAQRLLRRVCENCSGDRMPQTADRVASPHPSGARHATFEAACTRCGGTGFSGRVAATEFLTVTDEVRSAIAAGADASSLEALARTAGMRALAEHAADLLATGITTQGEVERVLGGNA